MVKRRIIRRSRVTTVGSKRTIRVTKFDKLGRPSNTTRTVKKVNTVELDKLKGKFKGSLNPVKKSFTLDTSAPRLKKTSLNKPKKKSVSTSNLRKAQLQKRLNSDNASRLDKVRGKVLGLKPQDKRFNVTKTKVLTSRQVDFKKLNKLSKQAKTKELRSIKADNIRSKRGTQSEIQRAFTLKREIAKLKGDLKDRTIPARTKQDIEVRLKQVEKQLSGENNRVILKDNPELSKISVSIKRDDGSSPKLKGKIVKLETLLGKLDRKATSRPPRTRGVKRSIKPKLKRTKL